MPHWPTAGEWEVLVYVVITAVVVIICLPNHWFDDFDR